MRGCTKSQEKKIIKRKITVIKLLNDGLTYRAIGKITHITPQRVMQIAKVNGLGDRWITGRVKKKNLLDEVTKDLNENLSIAEILSKRSIDRDTLFYIFEISGKPLSRVIRNKRNDKIVEDFLDGDTAKRIIKNPDKVFDDPNRLQDINSIYGINRVRGVKRYPQIGKRTLGGIFEDRKILRFITNKHDKLGWTFKDIAEKLNELGNKTIQGLPFEPQNTFVKYHSYKKNKFKRVKF